jgi:CheY-like chemotaxis protein
MDIHMPRLSGLQATDRIRSSEDDPPRNVPIIAVTADQKYHHPMAVKAHGMDGFLAKPIIPDDLLALIDQYCA